MLCICYFWDEFKIHATDVYHRYITSDISLACEIIDNAIDNTLRETTNKPSTTIPSCTRISHHPPSSYHNTTFVRADALKTRILALPKQSTGYVYCVAPAGNIDLMKVGHWKSTLENLERRYITYYGKDLMLHTRTVSDCRRVESDILAAFHDDRLSGELFPKSHWQPIVAYIDGA